MTPTARAISRASAEPDTSLTKIPQDLNLRLKQLIFALSILGFDDNHRISNGGET
jgi:hypothetical protein